MKRLKNSFAFRSGSIYKFITKLLPPPTFKVRPTTPLLFLSYKYNGFCYHNMQFLPL